MKANHSDFATENPGEVYLHGFDDEGDPADVHGFIYFLDEKLSVNKRMVNPDVPIDGYLVLERSTGDGYVSSYNYLANQFVIRDGSYGKDGFVVDELGWVFIGRMYNDQAEHTRSASVYERAKSLSEARDEVLAEVIFRKTDITQAEFNSILNYTGTEFFQRLAVSTLFVNDLIGNTAFLQQLFAKRIELQSGGAIYSGYSSSGVPPTGAQAGFHLSADGHFKARFAELLGTLRTGLGATDQARVAIQDETGISNLQFSGSGVNDIYFPVQGAVAGSFEVLISSKDTVVTDQEENTFSLGGIGPGGGVIFYDKGNWDNGWRYLESWTGIIQNQVHWGSEGIVVGTGSGIGSGNSNTDAMITTLGTNAFAALACNDFDGGGKTDWFLPSLDEAYQMRLQKHAIGIDGVTFWTSTEYASSPANYALTMSTFEGAINPHLGGFTNKNTQHITSNIIPIRQIGEADRWNIHETVKDGFQWRVTGGAYSAEILIDAGVSYPLTGYGIQVAFGSYTGHEVGDTWTFEQGQMYGLSVRDGGGDEYFKVSAGGIQTFKRGDMPIGATYIQFPGESPPGDIFTGTWSNISSNFAGRFFRAEGGNAVSFGSSQSHAQRRITGTWGGSRISFFNHYLSGSVYGDNNSTGFRPDKSSDDGAWQKIGIDTNRQVPTADEVRPDNKTIRIWKRIA